MACIWSNQGNWRFYLIKYQSFLCTGKPQMLQAVLKCVTNGGWAQQLAAYGRLELNQIQRHKVSPLTQLLSSKPSRPSLPLWWPQTRHCTTALTRHPGARGLPQGHGVSLRATQAITWGCDSWQPYSAASCAFAELAPTMHNTTRTFHIISPQCPCYLGCTLGVAWFLSGEPHRDQRRKS